MKLVKICFNIYPHFYRELAPLPWYKDLENWTEKDAEFLEIRKGVSRHIVRFIKREKFSFAVKQTSFSAAKKEIGAYHKILSCGIHTLIPAGYIVVYREPIEIKTPIGVQYEENVIAFVITILEDKTLPHSILYKYDFQTKNILQIWDAFSELLALLHHNNIYWGDASFANSLIKFVKEKDLSGKLRTRLRAFLADAETVEFFDKISDSYRESDIEYFFESMEWLNEDFAKAQINRKNYSLERDKKYLIEKYNYYYNLLKKIDEFEEKTKLSVRASFKVEANPEALEEIIKQIEEHKWYLSEKYGEEISLQEAAEDWKKNIYDKIINLFEQYNINNYFPNSNCFSLYLDIMKHKYFLSLEKKSDVGIEIAIQSYCEKYSEDKSLLQIFKNIAKEILKIIRL